jgi:hypothetical protein
MYTYAQHGYGKSDKIETAIRQGSVSGVILSPRDEQPERLAQYIAALRQEFAAQVTILFDPQFYATTVTPVRDGYLPDYPYYQPGLTRGRFIAPLDIQQYVSDVIDYQLPLGLDRIISPTVFFSDFTDPWSQIALSMAQQSTVLGAGQAQPLLLSLVFDETALRNRTALNDFLDIISVWDVEGFYLVIRRNDTTYQAFSDDLILKNLMYLTYVLAEVNDFEIVLGYSDFVGLLLHAVGAEATGTGWYNTLRQFSLARFQPATGGRPARPRYTSDALLNSILVVPELAAIYQRGRLPQVIATTAYDGTLANGNPANAAWPPDVACLHHWEVLSRLAAEVATQGSVAASLDRLQERIQQAVATYNLLLTAGIPFEVATGQRELDVWLRAIRSFRQEAGL